MVLFCMMALLLADIHAADTALGAAGVPCQPPSWESAFCCWDTD